MMTRHPLKSIGFLLLCIWCVLVLLATPVWLGYLYFSLMLEYESGWYCLLGILIWLVLGVIPIIILFRHLKDYGVMYLFIALAVIIALLAAFA